MAPNERRSEDWNGRESVHYVDHPDRYDRQLARFTEALVEQVRTAPHHSVLDVGCGFGALTSVRHSPSIASPESVCGSEPRHGWSPRTPSASVRRRRRPVRRWTIRNGTPHRSPECNTF